MVALGDSAAIVLAAGMSRRFGSANKLTAMLNGKPVLAHCIENLTKAGIPKIVVVSGHEAEDIAPLVAEYDVEIVSNPDFADGLGSSIAMGARAVPDAAKAVFIVLGDMPQVHHGIFQKLAEKLNTSGGICRPIYDNLPGHPVLFDGTYLPQLRDLAGDDGARTIIAHNRGRVTFVPADAGTILDIDTPEDLAKLRQAGAAKPEDY